MSCSGHEIFDGPTRRPSADIVEMAFASAGKQAFPGQ